MKNKPAWETKEEPAYPKGGVSKGPRGAEGRARGGQDLKKKKRSFRKEKEVKKKTEKSSGEKKRSNRQLGTDKGGGGSQKRSADGRGGRYYLARSSPEGGAGKKERSPQKKAPNASGNDPRGEKGDFHKPPLGVEIGKGSQGSPLLDSRRKKNVQVFSMEEKGRNVFLLRGGGRGLPPVFCTSDEKSQKKKKTFEKEEGHRKKYSLTGRGGNEKGLKEFQKRSKKSLLDRPNCECNRKPLIRGLPIRNDSSGGL